MPYILKHNVTSEIYTCTLINIYQFPYHGTKFWGDKEEAESQLSAFLQSQRIVDLKDWQLIEIEENVLKMCNVKLNNDSERKLYFNEQKKPIVKKEN